MNDVLDCLVNNGGILECVTTNQPILSALKPCQRKYLRMRKESKPEN